MVSENKLSNALYEVYSNPISPTKQSIKELLRIFKNYQRRAFSPLFVVNEYEKFSKVSRKICFFDFFVIEKLLAGSLH